MVALSSKIAERLNSPTFWDKQTMEKKPVLGTARYMFRFHTQD